MGGAERCFTAVQPPVADDLNQRPRPIQVITRAAGRAVAALASTSRGAAPSKHRRSSSSPQGRPPLRPLVSQAWSPGGELGALWRRSSEEENSSRAEEGWTTRETGETRLGKLSGAEVRQGSVRCEQAFGMGGGILLCPPLSIERKERTSA
jgi:hypothetical protein